MSRYRITDDDLAYAAEFKDQPFGYHSPGLQRVLNTMRRGTNAGKYVLVVIEPFKRWVLGRLPVARGIPVEIMQGREFTSLEDAEWAIFELRWKALTGRDLEL